MDSKTLQSLDGQAFVAAGYFQELERVVDRFGRHKPRYELNSGLISIFKSEHLQLPVSVSIRFHDHVTTKNATNSLNLTCGRVEFDTKMDPRRSPWVTNDSFCALEWHPDGLTCVCNRQGTFGLLRAVTVTNVSPISYS